MNIKLEDVGSYGTATDVIFTSNYDEVILFDPSINGTWKVDVFDVVLAAVIALVGIGGLKGENKADTKAMRKFMRLLRPILKTLKFKIEGCITAGTITVSLESFGLSALFESITRYDIDAFHLAYLVTYGQVNVTAIKDALIAAGFTAAQITSIKTNHDGAWGKNTAKIGLKGDIRDTSDANIVVINNGLDIFNKVLNSVKGLAISVGNTDLEKDSTQKAVLSSVRPAQAPKMRNKVVPKTAFKIHKTNPVERDTNKFKNNGKKSLWVLRSNSKTGPYSGGIEIKPGEEIDLKSMDIPGSGKYIIIYNPDVDNDGLMGCLIVKGAA